VLCCSKLLFASVVGSDLFDQFQTADIGHLVKCHFRCLARAFNGFQNPSKKMRAQVLVEGIARAPSFRVTDRSTIPRLQSDQVAKAFNIIGKRDLQAVEDIDDSLFTPPGWVNPNY
jgi:hypothetical protein